MKKCFKVMYKMEKQKYLEPKFAISLYPLIKFLKNKYGLHSNSTTTISFYSQSQRGGVIHPNKDFSLSDDLSMSSFMSTETRNTLPTTQAVRGLPITEME